MKVIARLEREREREREREWNCYDWHHIFLTHVAIHIFRGLLLSQEVWYRTSSQPRGHLTQLRANAHPTLLVNYADCFPGWLIDLTLGSKNFSHYIIFWRLHIFLPAQFMWFISGVPCLPYDTAAYPAYKIQISSKFKM